MANACISKIKIVAKDMNALGQFFSFLTGGSSKFHLRAPFEVFSSSAVKQSGELIEQNIEGSISRSWASILKPDDDMAISLQASCAYFRCGIEAFGEEPDGMFQEHVLINSLGELRQYSRTDWSEICFDENGIPLEEPIVMGGFKDFAKLRPSKLIYT